MDLTQIKAAIEAEQNRARSLKTKKAKEKAYGRIRELRWQAHDLLNAQCAKIGPQSIKGTVLRFSPVSDNYWSDLLVETALGKVWLNSCNDVLSKSWYNSTCCIEYTEGQTIVLEFRTEVNMDGLFLELVPGKVTGGKVNEAQYAELDKRTDLAFFKHSGAAGVTGLFAK